MKLARERPISDYGLIGNCRTGALVSTDGSIDWCCLPKFDSDSYFCSLLDRDIGGRFAITPAESFRARHHYLAGTNVLKTRFQSQHGVAELIDCFTVTDEETKRKGLWPDHEILRKLRCIRGSLKMRLVFYPTRSYGLFGLPLQHKPKWGIISRLDRMLLALQTDLPPETIRVAENAYNRLYAVAEFDIHEGQELWFSLIFENDEPAVWVGLEKQAEDRLRKTVQYWRNWIGRCKYQGEYEEEVQRSALALKLLTYAPSGAVVAAPTCSLPEWYHGTRNWDYRYCWLRDASFTVRVFVSLGYLEEARSYVSWLLHSTRLTRKPWKPRLQVLYDVYGETSLLEKAAPWLQGYRHSRPVRVGNAAVSQIQLDVYGEVVDSLKIIAPYLDEIDTETRDLILETGRAAVDLWDQPDHGIWEPRLPRAHHTHSKVLAWVALQGVGELARKHGWKTRYDFFSIARKVRQEIEAHGYNTEIGAYVGTFGGSELDASLLVLPMVGYCDPGSERIQNTIRAIQKGLTSNGFIYRYPSGTDGFTEPEGAFGICNFWIAEALSLSGRREEGKAWFDSLINRSCHEIGLWSEEIQPDSLEYLGNYPQAFTHVGLINAAIACSGFKAPERREAA